ncbi:MAG TPA: phosphohydrolase [Anaerolineaceae bacterium]|nr:MAG: phosphohydrolase [Chloroflexi bacterium GWB2_54_36]HAL16403.1 phosphohydrolase [Anaerolineaceae bacterium]HBA92357.1 phosphohydrolase [Anaerolineaceae bacterium]
MNIPSLEQAEVLLNEAQELHPGPWVQHSFFVGKAAEAIAEQHPKLDSQTAFILGYLHDIGRRAGVADMRHTLDGYYFLMEKGFDTAARICITHVFPVKHLNSVAGKWDCTKQELDFLDEYLSKIEFDEYDRLIQLCDAIALPTGYCLIEKRLMDVALRHGVNEFSVPRWKAFLEIQKEIESAIGQSIYKALNGVVENTFGFNPYA